MKPETKKAGKILRFPDMKEKKLKEHREKVYQDFVKFHVPLKKRETKNYARHGFN